MYQVATLRLCSNPSGRFYYAAINIPSPFTSFYEYFKHPAVYLKSKELLFRNAVTIIHCGVPSRITELCLQLSLKALGGGKIEVVYHYIDQQGKEDQMEFRKISPHSETA